MQDPDRRPPQASGHALDARRRPGHRHPARGPLLRAMGRLVGHAPRARAPAAVPAGPAPADRPAAARSLCVLPPAAPRLAAAALGARRGAPAAPSGSLPSLASSSPRPAPLCLTRSQSRGAPHDILYLPRCSARQCGAAERSDTPTRGGAGRRLAPPPWSGPSGGPQPPPHGPIGQRRIGRPGHQAQRGALAAARGLITTRNAPFPMSSVRSSTAIVAPKRLAMGARPGPPW